MDSKALLERFAPILRFDSRELFFPAETEPYVRSSALCRGEIELKAPGELTCDALSHSLGQDVHLRFISDSDRKAVLREEASRFARKLLSPRLGRVGIFGRVLDAIFLLSVFLRPTTPRLTTTAAALKSDRLRLADKHTVYGRVIRQGEWLVLHYSYFYVMNDWRSGYRGVNDHEADWEQVWVFVDPSDLSPQWVAASSHEHSGGDLRRHWSDPELITQGSRPVLFAGAGSHAMYFLPGDYVTRIEIPGTRWALRAQRWVQGVLRITDEATERGLGPALGVPFIDSAPGNGVAISTWNIIEVNDDSSFIVDYRGLWGLDTGDPTHGERGPSGPKFDRDGSLRTSWVDPLGFADLAGTPPPSAARRRFSREKLKEVTQILNTQIDNKGRLLPLISAQAEAGSGAEDAALIESHELTELLRQRTTVEDLDRHLTRGDALRFDIRSHLNHPAVPLPAPKGAGWLLAFWAAASVPALMILLGLVIFFDSLQIAGLGVVAAAMVLVMEQLVRRRFQAVLRLGVAYLLVLVLGAVVISGIVTASRYVVGTGLVGAAVLLFVANIGELTAVSAGRRLASAEANDH